MPGAPTEKAPKSRGFFVLFNFQPLVKGYIVTSASVHDTQAATTLIEGCSELLF